MGQENRLRLGILFNVSRSWLGGVYYIINLIKSLEFLDEGVQPEIVLFYDRELEDFTQQITYSRVTLVPWNFETPAAGYLKSWVKQKNCFSLGITEKYELDGLYPEWNQPVPASKAYNNPVKSVSWFADLQHKYYPEFFSKKQYLMREFRLRMMLRHSSDLVVSSRATESDFKKFYDLRDDLKIHVLNFVSVIDDFTAIEGKDVRKSYGLPENYFIVSNQFHKHKNHEILLKSLAELKKIGSPVHFAITGKMPDHSYSKYVDGLYDLMGRHDLKEHVSLLGVIPRNDQLNLMKHSSAVVQPSLFEGWSTVIEDAKSLQVPVIASNLDVNIEQLGDAGTFFNPHDEKALADKLKNFSKGNINDLYLPYEKRVEVFAEKFVHIFKN